MNQGNELTLQEVQKESLEVLKKVKKIFDQNGWKYYLTYGTLIGAIRHEGFIPWDDDIDIWVPRDDYEKFIQYCKENKENLKPFEIIHYSTNIKYIYPIARFSNSNYYTEYDNVKDYGLGLFVDIYPLDGINDDDKSYKKRITRINKDICLAGLIKIVKSNSTIKNIIKYPYFIFRKILGVNRLLIKQDTISKKYNYKDSEKVWVSWANKQIAFNKSDIINKEECFKKFENETFRVPLKYDKILTEVYGDYMKLPPKEERIAQHFYKVYKK